MLSNHYVGAAAPGPITPAKSDDARKLGSDAGTKRQGQQDNSDCAKHAAERKRQAGLQARAALAGIALRRLADGSWLTSHWGLSKSLADHEVAAWPAQTGAQA